MPMGEYSSKPSFGLAQGRQCSFGSEGGGGTEACYLEAYRDDCYDLSRVWVMRKSSYLSGSDEKEGLCKIF